MSKIFRPEALPFAAGFATAIGLGAIIWLGTQTHVPQFDIMDHPRSQQLEGRTYMKDGWLTSITLTIQTKEDLHTPFYEAYAGEFIGSVAAQFTSEEFEAMSLKFKEDTIKYLGLPCSAMFVNVSMTTPE